MRLDNYLVKNKIFESRSRAQNAIEAGLVYVDGKQIIKNSFKVDINSNIEVKESKFYVSRAAKKLEAFLEEYNIDFNGKRVLDIGSSTGGFSQIALEMGANSLDCVDVGDNQLHSLIREDKRVNVYENCDIRDFKKNGYDIIMCDVSFISLLKIVDSIDKLSKKDSIIILLFKPQFEVGNRVKRDKKGVVKDDRAIQLAKDTFLSKTKDLNWLLLYRSLSKVAGKEGNLEEFFAFKK